MLTAIMSILVGLTIGYLVGRYFIKPILEYASKCWNAV